MKDSISTATRDEIQRLFFELRDQMGQTFLIVTHDEKLASMSDRKIELKDGEILR